MKEKLNQREVKNHWKNWSKKYGETLRATTKNSFAKKIELAALEFVLNEIRLKKNSNILEVGCGNGHNIFYLAEQFKDHNFLGIDYIENMIESAESINNKMQLDNVSFLSLDLLDIKNISRLFHIIFTVRCIINVGSFDRQKLAIEELYHKLEHNGFLIMLENTKDNHEKQNSLREAMGMEKREQAEYNHFLCRIELEEFSKSLGLELIESRSISSFHDLLLYVLNPLKNNGKIDYEDQLLNYASELDIFLLREKIKLIEDIGQNHLYVFKKG
jgi:ubiquinone/menaquinone biosynthesis C-methylase UbiE